MSSLALTRHAAWRTAQRGIRNEDLALIVRIGTEVDGGYLVLDRDCQEAERALKHEIERIRRLRGKFVVIAADSVVTAYHARPNKEQRLLRRAEQRAKCSSG